MTRAELFASVLDDLNREDKANKCPEWLASAASRINMFLRDERMVKRAIMPITETLFALPPDYLQQKSIALRNGTLTTPITPGSHAGGLQYIPADDLDSGIARLPFPATKPVWYTIRGREIELGAWNGSNPYQVDLFYYAELPVLSQDTDTNWLLTKYPQIYKNAMLHFGFNHLLEYDTASGFMSSVMAEIQTLNDNAEKEKYGSGPLVMSAPRRIGGRRS